MKITFQYAETDRQPEIIIHMRDAFRQLKTDGKLHHDSGTFDLGDWGVWL